MIGLEAHAAIALSLLLVGGTAGVAVLLHQRQGHVDWRAGPRFALFGAPAGAVGDRSSRRVPGTTRLLRFGRLTLVAGAAMLRRRREAEGAAGGRRPLPITASGAGVGLTTGFPGIGGGFMIVPALVLFAHLPMRHAVGTSLLVIVATCLSALVGHGAAVDAPRTRTAGLAATVLAGTVARVALSRRLSPGNPRAAFGVFVVLVGLVLVIRNAAAVWR